MKPADVLDVSAAASALKTMFLTYVNGVAAIDPALAISTLDGVEGVMAEFAASHRLRPGQTNMLAETINEARALCAPKGSSN